MSQLGSSPSTVLPVPAGGAVSIAPEAAVVWVIGEQDLSNVDEFVGSLTAASAAGGEVIVDLSGVTFLSAIAVGAMVAESTELQRSGRTLMLRAPSASARRVLRLCGLQALIDGDRRAGMADRLGSATHGRALQ